MVKLHFSQLKKLTITLSKQSNQDSSVQLDRNFQETNQEGPTSAAQNTPVYDNLGQANQNSGFNDTQNLNAQGTNFQKVENTGFQDTSKPTFQAQPIANNQNMNYQNQNQSFNNQNTSGFDSTQSIVVPKKDNHLLFWIVLGVFALLAIIGGGFAAFSQTSDYRDLTTDDDEKVTKMVHWANNSDDATLDVDISLNDDTFEFKPREDGNFDEYYDSLEYYETEEADSNIKHYMQNLSKKVEDEWGDDYKFRLYNPDNDNRYLMETKNGSVVYNYLE